MPHTPHLTIARRSVKQRYLRGAFPMGISVAAAVINHTRNLSAASYYNATDVPTNTH